MCSFPQQPALQPEFKRSSDEEKKKKDEKEDFKQPNDATISQQLSPLLVSFIILSFVY